MKKRNKVLCAALAGGLILTGCGKGSGNPAQDVAESFLKACKKGNYDDMLDYSTIGLTDDLRADGIESTQQTLSRCAALQSYTLRQCSDRPEITGEYMALFKDTAKFRAASSSHTYGKGVPLFETLDAVCQAEFTGTFEGNSGQSYEHFYVISKDGQWAADMHCLEVMQKRLYAAEIDLCNDAAMKAAQAVSKALSEMKRENQQIEELEGVQTFTGRALSDAKAAEHTAVTKEELFQTLLAKTFANDDSLRDMEQFSVRINDGWVTAAAVQNDVYHSENGALHFIGYGTWPHPLNFEIEFMQNRDSINLELAMTLAKK